MTTLSLELSKKLSSLVSGFEGHYYYARRRKGNQEIVVICYPQMFCEDVHIKNQYDFICPAWTVEDVLRNWPEIEKHCRSGQGHVVVGIIALRIYQNGDTVYQKIEEYLWTILK